MKIIKYFVVNEETDQRLERKVNALLLRGWQPLGGVCITNLPTGNVFAQAMVQYENQNERTP